MLVLTRKPDTGNQSIITIGEGIEVTVLKIKGDQVQLGITAGRGVTVDRKEVWVQKQREAQGGWGYRVKNDSGE